MISMEAKLFLMVLLHTSRSWKKLWLVKWQKFLLEEHSTSITFSFLFIYQHYFCFYNNNCSDSLFPFFQILCFSLTKCIIICSRWQILNMLRKLSHQRRWHKIEQRRTNPLWLVQKEQITGKSCWKMHMKRIKLKS